MAPPSRKPSSHEAAATRPHPPAKQPPPSSFEQPTEQPSPCSQGGSIKFFYSLHALPCIGFRAELAGRSITYSGDTFYDPEGLLALQRSGVISEARRLSLENDCSVQESDLLMHEAGVPPIHTPMSALAQLPERIKRSVRVIHCSDQRAIDGGFEKVQPGFEHTIRIDAEPPRCAPQKTEHIIQNRKKKTRTAPRPPLAARRRPPAAHTLGTPPTQS